MHIPKPHLIHLPTLILPLLTLTLHLTSTAALPTPAPRIPVPPATLAGAPWSRPQHARRGRHGAHGRVGVTAVGAAGEFGGFAGLGETAAGEEFAEGMAGERSEADRGLVQVFGRGCEEAGSDLEAREWSLEEPETPSRREQRKAERECRQLARKMNQRIVKHAGKGKRGVVEARACQVRKKDVKPREGGKDEKTEKARKEERLEKARKEELAREKEKVRKEELAREKKKEEMAREKKKEEEAKKEKKKSRWAIDFDALMGGAGFLEGMVGAPPQKGAN